MDDGDAAHASLGTRGARLYARLAVEFGSRAHASVSRNRGRVPRRLCRVSRGDDLAHRSLGTETDRAMEKDAAHRRLGCHGVRNLAAHVWTKQHPLAERGL